MKTISRRIFLKDMALSAACLPFLPGLICRRASAAKPELGNLVLVYTPNGVLPDQWFPKQAGASFQLPALLEPLERHRDRLLIVAGLKNDFPYAMNVHAAAAATLWTGVAMVDAVAGVSDGSAGGISVDQAIARFLGSRPETRTRFASLEVGESVEPEPDPCNRLVYSDKSSPVPPEIDPARLFGRLFGTVGRAAGRKSVLDFVLQDLQRVRSQVGSEDARALDSHVAAVRELERQISSPPALAKCASPDAPSPWTLSPWDRPRVARLQIDLLVRALACQLTRVVTLQFTNGQSRAVFPWLGFSENHHLLSHANTVDKLAKINRWYAEQVAYLLDQLAAVPGSNESGSLLDQTTVVWMNDFWLGATHERNNLPVLIAGSRRYFKLGQYVNLQDVYHNRLLVTLCRSMGMPGEVFGDPRRCSGGPIAELT